MLSLLLAAFVLVVGGGGVESFCRHGGLAVESLTS